MYLLELRRTLNVDRAPQVQADLMLACFPCVQQYLPLWMVAPLL